jgi:ABC-type maltose transport system permease subunit
MKQKDIAVIAVIVFMSAIFAFIVTSSLFGGKKIQQTAEVVQPISADFPEPDAHYFNAKSIDPTKTITIGKSTNTDPFSSGTAQ